MTNNGERNWLVNLDFYKKEKRKYQNKGDKRKKVQLSETSKKYFTGSIFLGIIWMLFSQS